MNEHWGDPQCINRKNNIADTNLLLLSFHFEPRPKDPNSLLNLFSQLNLGPPNKNNTASSSSNPIASPREIKLNMPSPFSGKREDLTKFWQDCCIFTSINDEIYNNNKRKIAFILSLLTKREAASWKEQFVGQAILNCKKQGIPLDFGTFTVFETDLFEAFKPFDETGDAWAEIVTISILLFISLYSRTIHDSIA